VKLKGLVIGGGAAGMAAALGLASEGFEAVLVEREKDLGGNLKHIHYTLEGSDTQRLLADLVEQVEHEPRITIYKGATVKDFGGYVGNYETTLALADGTMATVEHGVVILATGAVEYEPVEYGAGQSDKVLTQVRFQEKLASGGIDAKSLKSVVMVQCVGSREPDHMYCSRICCSQAIANAIRVKDENPDAEVYILYRDIRTYGLKELKYREAREKGVTFVRYDVDRKPEVDLGGNRPTVKVFDSVLGSDLLLETDLVVLSAAVRPRSDAAEFASKLKLPLTQDGFFMEAHMKLRPLDFINEGMYLCGMSHAPKTIAESIAQAQGAVSRAATILSRPYLMVGGVVSVVDQERCVACLTCVRSCPFHVPSINGDGVAEIEAAACRGCGICAAACPRKAIHLQHYADDQVEAKICALYST
jgi:heterodisulfide reductase subunit A-like polyferredoxin